MIKNAVTWFEIPVLDFERAQKFYSNIFNFVMPENTMGNSRMGFFQCDFEAGGIGGAIVQGDGYVPSDKGSMVYLFTGDDLNTVLHRIPEAGGVVLKEKFQVGEQIGFVAYFKDTEGNKVALHSMV